MVTVAEPELIVGWAVIARFVGLSIEGAQRRADRGELPTSTMISGAMFLPRAISRRTVRSSTPREAAAWTEYLDNLSRLLEGRPPLLGAETSPIRTMISCRRTWWSARWAMAQVASHRRT
jgi:hypothetical protein